MRRGDWHRTCEAQLAGLRNRLRDAQRPGLLHAGRSLARRAARPNTDRCL